MRNNRRWESTGWGLRASTFQKWWQSIQQDLGESRGQERKEPSLEFQEKAFSDIAWTGQSRGKSPNTAPSQTLSHACVLPAPGRDIGRMASGISCDLHPIFPHLLSVFVPPTHPWSSTACPAPLGSIPVLTLSICV